MIRFGADVKGDELVCGRARSGFASSDEIGTRTANSIFNHVGDEHGEDHADEPAEDCNVRFVRSRAQDKGPGDEDAEGYGAGVDEEPGDGDAFVFCVGIVDGEVVEEEHAVEGFGEELYLCLVCQSCFLVETERGHSGIVITHQYVPAY